MWFRATSAKEQMLIEQRQMAQVEQARWAAEKSLADAVSTLPNAEEANSAKLRRLERYRVASSMARRGAMPRISESVGRVINTLGEQQYAVRVSEDARPGDLCDVYVDGEFAGMVWLVNLEVAEVVHQEVSLGESGLLFPSIVARD